MFSTFAEFWTFTDPNAVWVLCGAILLGASAAGIGCFAFLRKQALAGDAIAHAALPGVTTAFLLFLRKDPYLLLVGALVSCLLGFLVIHGLTRFTKIKQDSALAIVLSVFFAVGIFQLTMIQKLGIGTQAGLDKVLFGQAAALVRDDVVLLIYVSIGLLAYIVLCFEKLKMLSFDRTHSEAIGIRVNLYELSFAMAIVVAVVIGLQLVGVVLMAAMVLTPAAAARFWSDDLKKMVLLAAGFGAFSGLIGTNLSYLAPRMPTGPWMVVAITTIFLISLLFAPQRGVLARYYRHRRLAHKIQEENILRTVYRMVEERESSRVPVDSNEILRYRSMKPSQLTTAMGRLIGKGLIEMEGRQVSLTESGERRAKEVTRLHRLWELYLTERIQIAADHVHADAEEMEHILTAEHEKMLMQELKIPMKDPHGRMIPARDTEEEVP